VRSCSSGGGELTVILSHSFTEVPSIGFFAVLDDHGGDCNTALGCQADSGYPGDLLMLDGCEAWVSRLNQGRFGTESAGQLWIR
jgi:hypothetical protein